MREFNLERGDSGDMDPEKDIGEFPPIPSFNEIQRMKQVRKDTPVDAFTYCYWCKRKFIIMDEFKNDPLSEKEWRISGLCKMCQDAVFNQKEVEK
jgi:CRISPR/Cas system-associated protein Cas10 (large subunit of type III CRISPR-Cas system)